MSRTSFAEERSSPELLLTLRRGHGPSLRSQLESQLREAVRSGRLTPGSALPSTRALARELGVSRGVVVDCYAQLTAEGYLASRQGAPTRVSAGAGPAAPGEPPGALARPPRYDFRPGAPDLSLFPRERWAASVRRALRAAPDARLDYPDPAGTPELRAALASYLGRVRGVAARPEAVLVTSGLSQGMAITGRALRSRGVERVGAEDPGSGPGRAQVAATGLVVLGVPVDEHGVRADRLPQGLGALFVTPAHQFPLGVVLSPERRKELVVWATRTGALVVEDDYDAEYRYDRAPVGALQGLSPAQVLYAGSVSKSLAPALRLGWLVAPERLAPALARAKAEDDLGTPVVEQLALADFLERGELDRHLRRTRLVYRARRDTLVGALRRHLPQVRPAGVAAGLHVVVFLPESWDEGALLERARDLGLGLAGVGEHRVHPGPPALLLGYGRIAEPAIERGVRELARAAG